jgi:hypothetical protein
MTEADLPELHRRLIAMRQELVAQPAAAPDQLGRAGGAAKRLLSGRFREGVTFALLLAVHCSMGYGG